MFKNITIIFLAAIAGLSSAADGERDDPRLTGLLEVGPISLDLAIKSEGSRRSKSSNASGISRGPSSRGSKSSKGFRSSKASRSSFPSKAPSVAPSAAPSGWPSAKPGSDPTAQPTVARDAVARPKAKREDAFKSADAGRIQASISAKSSKGSRSFLFSTMPPNAAPLTIDGKSRRRTLLEGGRRAATKAIWSQKLSPSLVPSASPVPSAPLSTNRKGQVRGGKGRPGRRGVVGGGKGACSVAGKAGKGAGKGTASSLCPTTNGGADFLVRPTPAPSNKTPTLQPTAWPAVSVLDGDAGSTSFFLRRRRSLSGLRREGRAST